MTTTDPEKVRVNRLRRAAQRQGLRLEKSRSRDPRAIGYGTYHLVNLATNTLEVYGNGHGFGLNLDEIETALR
ncbi:MAG: hypothetical protein L0H24_09570 [Microlunatus sp.]|nr:hypothetical protein [Microlunatus sp.]